MICRGRGGEGGSHLAFHLIFTLRIQFCLAMTRSKVLLCLKPDVLSPLICLTYLTLCIQNLNHIRLLGQNNQCENQTIPQNDHQTDVYSFEEWSQVFIMPATY